MVGQIRFDPGGSIPMWKVALSLVWSFTMTMTMTPGRAEEPLRVYVGTYTEGTKSEGIYRLAFDSETGALTEPRLVAKTVNPSFLAIHPSGKFLYAVNEVGDFDGSHEGAVSGFGIDAATGGLRPINQQTSKGVAPCHLSVHPDGTGVIVANYGTGTVSVIAVKTDGTLGPLGVVFRAEAGSGVDPGRQAGPHAHCVRFDPSGRLVLQADLGADRIHALRFHTSVETAPLRFVGETKSAPGAGPRHLGFHPNGSFVFVNNEMNSTVTAYRLDVSSGTIDEIETESTLPEGNHEGNSTAETVVHPSGKFVYVSNRGHDSIAIFEIDPESGKLTPRGHQKTGGKTPRNFNIDPSGKWLIAANQSSDSLTVFRIDAETGALTQVGGPVEVPAPVCVVFQKP